MGFKDKLSSLKEAIKPSPVSVTLAEKGSDKIVTPGGPATVKVQVSGVDDGTIDRIEISLRSDQAQREWPLGQIPVEIGLQSLDVTIPDGLPPSCALYSEYFFKGKVFRTSGNETDGLAAVDVISLPDTIYWPPGARSGTDGASDVRIEISLDRDAIDTGTAVTGTVRLTAGGDTGKVDVNATVSGRVVSGHEPDGKTIKGSTQRLEKGLRLAAGEQRDLPFSLVVPGGRPPTLRIGPITEIVWKVTVTVGKASAWHLVGVMDPKAEAGMGARRGSGWGDILTTSGP